METASGLAPRNFYSKEGTMERGSVAISTVAFTALAFAVAACGGSDPTGPDEQDSDSEPEPLDFGAVAGTWSGWGTITTEGAGTIQSWLRISLQASARRGEIAGDATEGDTDQEGNLVEGCVGDLRAVSAFPPVYRYDLVITGGQSCVGGTLRVEHDPEANTLIVDFTAETGNFTGSHTVRPGSNPGPPPSLSGAPF